jgi:hypothetical protein
MRRREIHRTYPEFGSVFVGAVSCARNAGKAACHRFWLVSGVSPSVFRPTAELIERRLGELGWIVGRDVIVEYRYAEGSLERAAEIALDSWGSR